MFFSAHLFDSSPLAAIKRRAPTAADAPGLLSARTAICAPFSYSMLPSPQLGRESLVACWEDESALERFLEDDPTGRDFAQGWHVRLELVRALGVFPGLENDMTEIAGDKADAMTGPTFAITMGTAYVKTIPTFYRVNKGLERQFLATPNALWGTAMSNLRTRFVATLTAWESLDAATEYVKAGAHGEAVRNHFDPKNDLTGHTFVTGGGFFGFRPLSMHGQVTGKNAIAESLLVS
ncbi:MAG: hypothetical protein R8J94_19620 [Acidimicrobiia bacterium]|nr:hypothetical protein [Acidimicrobiia bacterium]